MFDPNWIMNLIQWQTDMAGSGTNKDKWMNNFGRQTAPSLMTGIGQGSNQLDTKTLATMTPKTVANPPKKTISGFSGIMFKTGDFLRNNASTIGGITDASSAFFKQPENATVAAGDQVFNAATNAIMGVNPLVGGLMKLGGLGTDIMRATGFDIKNPTNKADELMSSKLLSLTPVSMLNTATRKKVEGTAGIGKTINYGYTPQQEIETADIGGVTNWFSKTFGGGDLAAQRKNAVKRTNTENALKSSALSQNTKNLLASSNTMQDIYRKNTNKLGGGFGTNILAAKKGAKISRLRNLAMSTGRNVIPSGALHARKNNLPDHIAKDVTNKGIPVVSMKESGGLMQHAEIEHSEIIFNKAITDQLEALLKDYNNGNEDAAIEAGKLLTYEILENTDDNTGILNG